MAGLALNGIFGILNICASNYAPSPSCKSLPAIFYDDTDDRLMIKQEFIENLKNYTTDTEQRLTMWNEVEKNYSKSDRHMLL